MQTLAPRGALSIFCCLVVASIALGCGIAALVPVDELRGGHPRSLRFAAAHSPFANREVVFSHEVHESIADCDRCHFGTASPDTTGTPRPVAASTTDSLTSGTPVSEMALAAGVAFPSMALCFECHNGVDVTRDCIACHRSQREGRKPGFHDGLWPRHHKEMAEDEEYKCALCHVRSDCRGCHQERRPLSHTPRFLRSTHGRMSTHDRRSCATCHETSFCENCHSQPPPNHTLAFRRGGGHKQQALIQGRACLVCHSFQDVCAECHG